MNIEVEQPWAGLVANPQQISKTAIDQQQTARALALQQRVGGHRRAHFNLRYRAFGNTLACRQPEACPDTGNRRVLIPSWVLRQQFSGGDPAIRIARHDIRERAPAIDPELPARHLLNPEIYLG